MTIRHDRSSDDHLRAQTSAPAGEAGLSLGQRRAAVWPSIAPSVSHLVPMGVLVGVVHTADSVRFIAIAHDESALVSQLAAYVAANARDRLWITDAARVHSLLEARDFEGAIRIYFTAPDTPWDRDWLVIEVIHSHHYTDLETQCR